LGKFSGLRYGKKSYEIDFWPVPHNNLHVDFVVRKTIWQKVRSWHLNKRLFRFLFFRCMRRFSTIGQITATFKWCFKNNSIFIFRPVVRRKGYQFKKTPSTKTTFSQKTANSRKNRLFSQKPPFSTKTALVYKNRYFPQKPPSPKKTLIPAKTAFFHKNR